MNQHTLRHHVSFVGTAVHSSEYAMVTFHPAPPNAGFVFKRGLFSYPCHRAEIAVTDKKYTVLRFPDFEVCAPEHILSALLGLEVDNAIIEMHGEGIPLLDGSAALYTKGILDVGLRVQEAERQFIRVSKPIVFSERMVDYKTGEPREERSYLAAFPRNKLIVRYRLDYLGTALPKQEVSMPITPDAYKDIAQARTFMTEWEITRWRGTVLTEHFCNTVPLVSDSEVFEERVKNEAAKHKVLDLLGDLATLGKPLRGLFVGIRSGHSLNRKMREALCQREALS